MAVRAARCDEHLGERGPDRLRPGERAGAVAAAGLQLQGDVDQPAGVDARSPARRGRRAHAAPRRLSVLEQLIVGRAGHDLAGKPGNRVVVEHAPERARRRDVALGTQDGIDADPPWPRARSAGARSPVPDRGRRRSAGRRPLRAAAPGWSRHAPGPGWPRTRRRVRPAAACAGRRRESELRRRAP